MAVFDTLIYVLTMALYLLCGVVLGVKIWQNRPNKHTIFAYILPAFLLHGYLWLDSIDAFGAQSGFFLTFSTSISLTTWFFVLYFILFAIGRPILSLGILAIFCAFFGILVDFLYINQRTNLRPTTLTPALGLHIFISFGAYCLLFMSMIQAIILRLQIRELKHKSVHRFWVEKLPPLQSMDWLLFGMILLGFILLSLSQILGFWVLHDIFAQHVAHKTVFSLLSWLVFGGLIIGRYKAHWHSRRMANLTITGFLLLAIGFIGSKFVLDVIL